MSFRTKTTVQTLWDQIRTIKSFKPSFLFQSTDQFEQIDVTNYIFKLHSKLTVTILLVGTFFVTLKVFGNPIECLMRENGLISKQLMEHYCWIEGVFSVHVPGPVYNGLKKESGTQGVDFAYPGVRSSPGKRINHKYYQWVYFVLIIQAVLFYIPEYVWRNKESNYINHLVLRLKNKPITELQFSQQKVLLQDLFDILITSENYLTNFIFCEIYYIFNLVVQFWFTDILLGGSFRNLGWNWFSYANSDKSIDISYDPLVKVFPRLAKCLFHRYDVSGSIVTHDAMCFLSLNIVNEKIYVILWLWFLFLFMITSVHLLIHMMIVNSTTLRYLKLKYYAPKVNSKYLRILCKNAGNWFILEYVVVNIKPHYFNTLINSLFDEFYDKRGNALVNQTVMDKYKRINNEPLQSTSYHQDSCFDLPPTNNYNQFNNQFTNTPFNQSSSRHNTFLSPSSPTNDLVLPSIIPSGAGNLANKFTATARRTKKKQLRSSLSASLANKSSDFKPEWDNQETAPFLNELTELDILDNAPSSYSSEKRKLRDHPRDFRKSTSFKKDSKSTFGANDTSLNINTDNGFESLMTLNSDEEWK